MAQGSEAGVIWFVDLNDVNIVIWDAVTVYINVFVSLFIVKSLLKWYVDGVCYDVLA